VILGESTRNWQSMVADDVQPCSEYKFAFIVLQLTQQNNFGAHILKTILRKILGRFLILG